VDSKNITKNRFDRCCVGSAYSVAAGTAAQPLRTDDLAQLKGCFSTARFRFNKLVAILQTNLYSPSRKNMFNALGRESASGLGELIRNFRSKGRSFLEEGQE
jgi:hypothetical protein